MISEFYENQNTDATNERSELKSNIVQIMWNSWRAGFSHVTGKQPENDRTFKWTENQFEFRWKTFENVPGPNTLPNRTRAGGRFWGMIRLFSSTFKFSIKLRSLMIDWTWSTKIVTTNKPNKHDSMQMIIEWTLKKEKRENVVQISFFCFTFVILFFVEKRSTTKWQN